MYFDMNAVDEETEKSAKRYFNVQDKGWPAPAVPEPGRPIFVDGLSLVYLQHTGLLQPLLRAFPTVYIHVSTEEEANVLIEHDHNVYEVLRVIDDIRSAVRRANAAGRVTFGPRRADTGENDWDAMQSTVNLLTNLKGAEAVVFASVIGCDFSRTFCHLAFCACAILRREAADITRVGWFACGTVLDPFNDSITEIA